MSATAQLFRRTINTTEVESRSEICEIATGGKYVASSGDGSDEILIIKYDDLSKIVWQQTVQAGSSKTQLVDIEEDKAGNLIVLFNDLSASPNSFGLIKINKLTGIAISTWRYNISGSTDYQIASKLAIGDNANYFVSANEYAGTSDYNKGIFLEISRNTGSVVRRAVFNLPRLAIYDIAQLNSDEWIIGGTFYQGHYKTLVIKFNLATNIVTHSAFDLAVNHNNVDRLAIDRNKQRIYFASSLWNGQEEDVGVTCLSSNLAVGWSVKTNTTAIAANERASSLIYDDVNDQLIVTGKNSINTDYSFIMCLNAADGKYQWGKHLAGITLSNKVNSFSAILSNDVLFFTSILNGDVIWGREFYSAEVSDCFDQLNYNMLTLPAAGTQEGLTTSNPIVTLITLTLTQNLANNTETVNCIKDEGLPTGEIDYESSICIGSCITIGDKSLKADEWHWTFGGGIPSKFTGQNPPDICFKTAGTFNIRLIVTNVHGADTVDSVIVVHALPEVFTYQDLFWCSKDTFKLAVAGTADTHEWKGFTDEDELLPNNLFIPAQTNTYTVVGTDKFGCKDSASFLLSILKPPVGKGFEKLICLEEVLRIDIGNGEFDHQWSDFSTDSFIIVDTTGIYSVKVSNPCYKQTYTFKVTERDCNSQHYIPTAFRPNGDGVNDVFYIPGNNIEILKLEVYNRWGVKVFEGNEDNNYTWDGKYQGVYVEQENYIYIGVIRIVTGRKLRVKGTVMVIR